MLIVGLEKTSYPVITPEEVGNGNQALFTKAQEELQSHGIKGKILFVVESGASVYGLETEEEDYVAVYVEDTKSFYDPLEEKPAKLSHSKTRYI